MPYFGCYDHESLHRIVDRCIVQPSTATNSIFGRRRISLVDPNKSFNIENERNNYRNQLKDQNVLDVNNKEYNYQTGDHYMDIISECEKLGDYVVNVVEARTDIKEKKI